MLKFFLIFNNYINEKLNSNNVVNNNKNIDQLKINDHYSIKFKIKLPNKNKKFQYLPSIFKRIINKTNSFMCLFAIVLMNFVCFF